LEMQSTLSRRLGALGEQRFGLLRWFWPRVTTSREATVLPLSPSATTTILAGARGRPSRFSSFPYSCQQRWAVARWRTTRLLHLPPHTQAGRHIRDNSGFSWAPESHVARARSASALVGGRLARGLLVTWIFRRLRKRKLIVFARGFSPSGLATTRFFPRLPPRGAYRARGNTGFFRRQSTVFPTQLDYNS